jgi:RNA polymerase sigma-70 factor (ECF subfamily)
MLAASRLSTAEKTVTGQRQESSDCVWLSLTRQIRAGNPDSLTVFYDHFFNLVFQEVRRIGGRDEATSLDLAQDTFLNIIRRIKPMAGEAHVTAWVRTVARTTTYDWLRKQRRQFFRDRNYQDTRSLGDPTADFDSAEPQDEDSDTEARLALIREKLEALPAEMREMISLRYRLGWTLSRIGQRFGLKSGAVDGRVRRAIQKIRNELDGKTDD